MDKLDRLYELYDILSQSSNKAEREAEYLEIIQAKNGNTNEKCLACQFIPKFIKDFPHLSETALEAQIDLAEDDDVSVRKIAVKHLPGFCKESKQSVTKVADILTQMLQSDDTIELATAQSSLMTVMELDVKGALQGILIQISTTEDDIIRKRAIDFLNSKFQHLPEDIVTKEIEEFVIEACKKVFPKVSGADFLKLLPLLFNLKISKTIPVQKAIVDIIADQLEFDSDFEVTADNVAAFIHCVQQAVPFFSPFVSSKNYVERICLDILPKLDDIIKLDNGDDFVSNILKLLAEISMFINKDDKIENCIEIVFNHLLKYIPLPPPTEGENDLKTDEPNLQFTYIECLLYTFVQFLKYNDEFITSNDNLERFKDLKLRLQFLSRGVVSGLKNLKESQKTVKIGDKESEESKLKAIAMHTMNNINVLIKDFFRIPPSFKSAITLSWKSAKSHSGNTSVKRESDASTLRTVKRERRARELYVPPTGKYSSRLDFSGKDSFKFKKNDSRV